MSIDTTSFADIAEQAKGLARQFKAVIAIGDAIAGLGSLDTVRAELEALIATHRSTIETLASDIADKQATQASLAVDIEAKRQEVSDVVPAAEERARKIVSDAEQEIEIAKAQAATFVERVTREAQDRADEIAAKSAERQARADDEFEKTDEEYKAIIQARSDVVAALEKQIDLLQAEARKLRDKIGATDITIVGEKPVVIDKP